MWIQAPISVFCTTGSGGTPSRNKAEIYFSGNIPWVKSGELKEDVIHETEEKINELALKESSAKLVPSGTVLIAMYGATVGKTALLGVDAATNQAVCHIIPNKKIADTKYFWYALRTKVPELLSRRVGGAQPNISQQIIRSTKIPLPPLSEQRRIVEILDQADALRKKRAEANAKAERILPALFYKMFGDPATNPKGWKVVKMREIIAETRNGLYKHGDYFGRGTQILKMFNIQNGELNLERIDLVEVDDEEFENYKLDVGDILLNRVNTPELVGKCAVITPELGRAIFESKNIRIRIKRNLTDPDYVAHYLNCPFGHATLRQGVKHAIGMATINNSDLRTTLIPLPPLEQQKAWGEAVRQFRSIRKDRNASKKKLDSLFTNLLHRAFSGDLTAKWRETHAKELLAEMEDQAKMLRSSL
jgi:type I restriction enzyme S subunit